jgi:hypothetical protein
MDTSIGEELIAERRRRRRAGDPRLSEQGRELFRRMTTGDLADEFQESLDSISAADRDAILSDIVGSGPAIGSPIERHETGHGLRAAPRVIHFLPDPGRGSVSTSEAFLHVLGHPTRGCRRLLRAPFSRPRSNSVKGSLLVEGSYSKWVEAAHPHGVVLLGRHEPAFESGRLAGQVVFGAREHFVQPLLSSGSTATIRPERAAPMIPVLPPRRWMALVPPVFDR